MAQAVMAPPPSAKDDAATIARASELLRTNPDIYWRDVELQESQYEALERQEAAAAPTETRRADGSRGPPHRTAALISAVMIKS